MDMSLSNNQLKVLTYLKQLLDKNNVPFIVIGGLASIAWGVKRPLADIDIQVKNADLLAVKRLLSNFVTSDIRHYVTDNWDIQQMVLGIDNVGIDVCGAEAFYVVKNNRRYLIENCIEQAVCKNIQDIPIPVMPIDVLISYKKIVARPVDLQDLLQLGF